MNAIVLLSGGMDSAVSAWLLKSLGVNLRALIVDYGQRHRIELDRASKLADLVGCESVRVISLHMFPGAPLTDGDATASCHVYGRNLVLLSAAMSYAEETEADAVVIGCNADDAKDHADCRPSYLRAVERMVQEIHGPRFCILAPMSGLTKSHVVRLGSLLGVPWHVTWSCYSPRREGVPCQCCAACQLRSIAFRDANVTDTGYRG